MSAVDDAFARLGINRNIAPTADVVDAAYRDRAKAAHPDSGGDAEEFEALSRAKAVLLDDVERVRHLALLAGVEAGELSRGAMSGELTKYFGSVADVVTQAKGVTNDLEKAQSALQKALLQKRVMAAQAAIGELQGQLGEVRNELLGGDVDLKDGATLAAIARDLAFLGRWQGELRKAFGALWVG